MKTLTIERPASSEGLKEISTIYPIPVLHTDALTGLKSVASASAQVCLTSPPFYLLRRYGTATTWPDGWEGELGHEPHPNDFTRHLLHVFDEVWRTLRDDGWLLVTTRGSHRQFKHPVKSGRVTVAGKPSDDIAAGTLNSILKQAEIKK